MQSCFNKLFSVSYLHEYFPVTVFAGLKAMPDNETKELMVKNGLLFKSYTNGFYLLYDKYFAGKERTMEEVQHNRLALCFLLTLTDQHFYNYTTDFGANVSEFNFLFTNRPGVDCPTPKGNGLHRDAWASAKELTIRSENETGLFGKIVITIDSSLQPDYYIRFAQKATWVRYFLVSDHLQALEQPAVIDSSGRYHFSGVKKVTLTNGKSALCFISETAMPFSYKERSNFNLVEDYDQETGKYKIVRTGLPLPDVRAVSKALEDDGSAGKYFSDIFL